MMWVFNARPNSFIGTKKKVITFLLDDRDVRSKDVVTETCQSIGYDYTNKLYPEDTVTISDKSKIGKEMVKKFTGDNDEIPVDIIINDPTVMDNDQRKANVLVLVNYTDSNWPVELQIFYPQIKSN